MHQLLVQLTNAQVAVPAFALQGVILAVRTPAFLIALGLALQTVLGLVGITALEDVLELVLQIVQMTALVIVQ
jgi:hypothetical protein